VKLSVVMAVHNGAAQLAETLDSILAQSFHEFELIVIDDGSTDATNRILGEYAVRDARIRALTQPNSGLTRALIRGCEWARGTYIARHDAGDLSPHDRFRKQLATLDAHPDLAFVSCWTELVGPELEPLSIAKGNGTTKPLRILSVDAEHGVTDGPTHHGSVIFRRDLYERVGGYRPEFYYGQDWDLWYRLADEGTFAIIPEVLYRARVAPESISGSSREAQQSIAQCSLEAMRARKRGFPETEILARAAAIQRTRPASRAPGLYFIGETLRRNGDRRARHYLAAAIRESPLMVKAWVRWVQTLF
jgi:glycosyltransferase involved in cell wall biosynthesis